MLLKFFSDDPRLMEEEIAKRTLLSWSSGKDSAWCLHVLQKQPEYEVVGLLTTFNREADRVAMHGVRRSLVEAQARAAELPLWDVDLPWPCSNADYECIMKTACQSAVEAGVECMAFGDLFLTDIRQYRERQLQDSGLQLLFPVWEMPTAALARAMMAGGLRAQLVCIDSRVLGEQFAGREFDQQLLAELPAGVDPCGENGEFHTFVYDGPMFREPVALDAGEIVKREQFVFADLIPRDAVPGTGA